MAILPSPSATANDDTLYGGTDNDTLSGLGGNDLILGLAGEDLINGDDGNDTLYGGDYNDTIFGGADNDVLYGDGMVDELYGDAGNDRIELGLLSGGSVGSAYGGDGDDTLRVFETSGSTLRGGDDTDLLDIVWLPLSLADDVTIDFDAGIAQSASGMQVDFAEFERLSVFLGSGDDVVTASALDDFLWVGGGANEVDAGTGNDTVRYEIGAANTLEGGAGDADRLIAIGDDNGTPVYFIYDSYEGDVDDGQLSLITGFEAFDVIGQEMNDIIATGAGVDNIYGNGGEDTLFGMGGADRISGGDGADEINGGTGRDTLVGDGGNDTITGDLGYDLLTGSGGSDVLYGGGNGDTLNGGWGFDRLTGGTGADVFFHLGVAGHGTDWVTDYSAAQGDVLTSGLVAATVDQFQINYGTTPGAGQSDVAEAFVIYRPTGQVLWAITDGAAQEQIYLRIAGVTYDLMA